ncbi:hypothetical protein FA15DRAFT_585473, partial [Coprinopsis marcescibilis]
RFLAFCIQYASLTLVYYDYFLTLPREIKFVWRRKFHVMTIVYFLCRYAIISNVVFAIGLYNKFHHMRVSPAFIRDFLESERDFASVIQSPSASRHLHHANQPGDQLRHGLHDFCMLQRSWKDWDPR